MSRETGNSDNTDERGNDIRPVVRTSPAGNMGLWAFVAVLLIGGLLLFQALQANRPETEVPATQASSSSARIASLPPLSLPQYFFEDNAAQPLPPAMAVVQAPPAAFPERYVTRVTEQPAPLPMPQPAWQAPASAADGQAGLPRPAIVYDTTIPPAAAPRLTQTAATGPASQGEERVMAGRLQNPAFTVPKGSVIPAVLESAMDSTRPGAIRALVTRDVLGFDGTRLLIPRGSRLYGEYEADLNYGQNRAMVRWTRLLRPDGVTIELDSPAADPLGRAGLGGKVNTHFWSRFGAAILQSVLDIGVGVATRSVDDAVVVALPGSTQNISRTVTEGQGQVRPTLTVKQGTSVSVFVARDLDFSSVDR